MKKFKMAEIIVLFLIGITILSLHIIQIAGSEGITKFYQSINGTNYYTYEESELMWFGEPVSATFLYDVVLYITIFLVFLCAFMILLEDVEWKEKNKGDVII